MRRFGGGLRPRLAERRDIAFGNTRLRVYAWRSLEIEGHL
jgi:hypothetical protein